MSSHSDLGFHGDLNVFFWPLSVILGPEIQAILASASPPKTDISRAPTAMSQIIPLQSFVVAS